MMDSSKSKGFTLLELLITLLVSSILMTAVLMQLGVTAENRHDIEIKLQTKETARSVMEMMVIDIRNTGGGMPLTQDDFNLNSPLLSDISLPLLVESDTKNLYIRVNQSGESTYLTEDFSPGPLDLTLRVLDSSNFEPDDSLYISDMEAGGESGLFGIVNAVSGSNEEIELTSDYLIPLTTTTLSKGSTVSQIDLIEWHNENSGINRIEENTKIEVVSRGSFSIQYIDETLNYISLPLSNDKVINSLKGIEITINVESQRTLKSGERFTTSLTKSIPIESLLLK